MSWNKVKTMKITKKCCLNKIYSTFKNYEMSKTAETHICKQWLCLVYVSDEIVIVIVVASALVWSGISSHVIVSKAAVVRTSVRVVSPHAWKRINFNKEQRQCKPLIYVCPFFILTINNCNQKSVILSKYLHMIAGLNHSS